MPKYNDFDLDLQSEPLSSSELNAKQINTGKDSIVLSCIMSCEPCSTVTAWEC